MKIIAVLEGNSIDLGESWLPIWAVCSTKFVNVPYPFPAGLPEGSIVKIRAFDGGRYDVEFDRKVFNVSQVCVSFKGETGTLL